MAEWIQIPSFNKSQVNDYYNDELSQSLVSNIGYNGFNITPQSTDNINSIASSSPTCSLLFNTDSGVPQFVIGDTVYNFTLTPV